MPGLIGKKVGMTSVFDKDGKNIPCTVIEVGPCVITQIKKEETDGYNSVQLAYEEKKEKNATKAEIGHFNKANTTPKKKVVEFSGVTDKELGDELTVDFFKDDLWLDVTGFSKGKGFQGVVKRYNFHGVGGQTHGQQDRNRAPGSIGASSYPSRVFKGMRMGGHMGDKKVKLLNLKVVKIISEHNLLLLKGAVPGAKGSYLIIEK